MAALTVSRYRTQMIGDRRLITGRVTAAAATGYYYTGLDNVQFVQHFGVNAETDDNQVRLCRNSQTASDNPSGTTRKPGYVYFAGSASAEYQFVAVGT